MATCPPENTPGALFAPTQVTCNSPSDTESDTSATNLPPDVAALLNNLDAANELLTVDAKFSPTADGLSVCSADVANSAEERWKIWSDVVKNYDEYRAANKLKQVKSMVLAEGVPHQIRAVAWKLLVAAPDLQNEYAAALRKTSPFEKSIQNDVGRTFPDLDFFRNQEGRKKLFNVLKAYSLRDREVGYCQGSAFITGLLLLNLPEEDAFAVLAQLMEAYGLRHLFKPNMLELGRSLYQLDLLIQDELPVLYQHFRATGFEVSVFGSPWILTLYASVLPPAAGARVIELLIADGSRILFRVAIALLARLQERLLCAAGEGLIRMLQREYLCNELADSESVEELAQAAVAVKLNEKKLDRWEKEYKQTAAREQETSVELRRLRTENGLLRERVRSVEAETRQLADKLLTNQVQQAETKDEVEVQTRELERLKAERDLTTQEVKTLRLELAQSKVDLHEAVTRALRIQTQRECENEVANPEMIADMSKQLVAAHLQVEDFREQVTSLTAKLKEVEEIRRRLETEPGGEVAALQQQLICAKLDNGEATLAMEEQKGRLRQLEKMFAALRGAGDGKTTHARELQEQLLAARLREADSAACLVETRHRLAQAERELSDRRAAAADAESKLSAETSRAISARQEREKLSRRLEEAHSQREESQAQGRLVTAEKSHEVAELRRRVEQLEVEKHELLTRANLAATSVSADLDTSDEELSRTPTGSPTGRRRVEYTAYSGDVLDDPLSENEPPLITDSMIFSPEDFL